MNMKKLTFVFFAVFLSIGAGMAEEPWCTEPSEAAAASVNTEPPEAAAASVNTGPCGGNQQCCYEMIYNGETMLACLQNWVFGYISDMCANGIVQSECMSHALASCQSTDIYCYQSAYFACMDGPIYGECMTLMQNQAVSICTSWMNTLMDVCVAP